MSRCASPATLAPVMAFARCRSRASNDGAKRIDSGVVMTTLYLLRYSGPPSVHTLIFGWMVTGLKIFCRTDRGARPEPGARRRPARSPPFGIGLTIVEPRATPTGFASAVDTAPVMPEYENT